MVVRIRCVFMCHKEQCKVFWWFSFYFQLKKKMQFLNLFFIAT